jgi:uncharacterized protein YjbJ (UPF0337 family)
MDEDRDLGEQGAVDRIKGNVNQGLGSVEEKSGRATGDEETEDSGLERQGKGKVQEGLGKAKQVLDDTLKP